MKIEYWLQKKTIGGWSHVTWYSDQVEAKRNFDAASSGLSGYSWRLVSVEVLHEKMLEEVVQVEAPVVELVSPLFKMRPPVQDKPKSNPWDDGRSNGWNSTPIYPIKNAGSSTSNPKPASGWNSTVEEKSQHGLAGKVWMINHSTKSKVRVSEAEVKLMTEVGYERGGPRTQFRS